MPISNTSPNLQLWTAGAGGGHGLFSVNGDPNTDMGMTGFQLAQFYQNTTDNLLTTTVAEGLFRPNDIVFDTVHGKFFVADSDSTGHNRVLQGNIADLLARQSARRSPCSIKTRARAPPPASTISRSIPNNGQVFFTHGQRLESVNLRYRAADSHHSRQFRHRQRESQRHHEQLHRRLRHRFRKRVRLPVQPPRHCRRRGRFGHQELRLQDHRAYPVHRRGCAHLRRRPDNGPALLTPTTTIRCPTAPPPMARPSRRKAARSKA